MNYKNVFIAVADDCPEKEGIIPIVKDGKTTPIHAIQYSLITENPYQFTQEDIQFLVYAERKGIEKNDSKQREEFLSKPQACFRSSALAKRYGWGIHFNDDGKAAIYSRSSEEYENLMNNSDCKIFKAMRNKRSK